MSSRRLRGLTENIYLVKLETPGTGTRETSEPQRLVFHVLGTSHRVYRVVCESGKDPKCTCPDHSIRKRICKHTYFVCERVMQIAPFDWCAVTQIPQMGESILKRLPNLADRLVADDDLTQKYDAYLQGKSDEKKIIQLRNDECCVCLSDMTIRDAANDGSSVMVCSTCQNGIHETCWEKWCRVNDGHRCVYCRSKINQSLSTVLKKSEWGVVLE